MRTDVGLGGVGSHRKIQDPAKWKEEATREGREWSLGPWAEEGPTDQTPTCFSSAPSCLRGKGVPGPVSMRPGGGIPEGRLVL